MMRHAFTSYLLAGLTTAFAVSPGDAQGQKFQAEWIRESPVVTIGGEQKTTPALQPTVLSLAFQDVDSARAAYAQTMIRGGYDFYHQVMNAGGQYMLRNDMATEQGAATVELTIEPDSIGLAIVNAHDSTHISLKNDPKNPGHIMAVQAMRHLDIDDSTAIEIKDTYALNGADYTKISTYLKVMENGTLIATGSTQWDDKGGSLSRIELLQPTVSRFHSYDRVADKPFGKTGTYQLFMDRMPSKAQSYLKKYVVAANN